MPAGLLFRVADAPLDLADVVEVVGEPRPVARAEAALERASPVCVTPSRMLRFSCIRASRCAGVPAPPNMRSNTTRGFVSIGSGDVGPAHEIVFM